MGLVLLPEERLVLCKSSGSSGAALAMKCQHPQDMRAVARIDHGDEADQYDSEICLQCGHVFHLKPTPEGPTVQVIRTGGSLSKSYTLDWVWPGQDSEEIMVLAKSVLEKATPPGHRWITVHPHKDPDEPGYPVLIKLHPDGTGHIVGGAGGALNGMHLTRLKSPSQLATERRKRQQERAEKRRDAASAMSAFQAQSHRAELEKLASMKDEILDQKIEVAKRLGIIDRGPELTEEENAGLTAQEQKQALSSRRRKIARAVDKAFTEIKQKLAAENPVEAAEIHGELVGAKRAEVEAALSSVLGPDAARHADRILGETYDDLVMPEVKSDQISIGETLADRASANGLTPEVQEAATKEADLAAADWMVHAGYADSREEALEKRDAIKQRARLNQGRSAKVKALTEALAVATPDPDAGEKKAALAELGGLKAQEKAIQSAKRSLMDWDPRIDEALPSGVALTYQKLTGKGGWYRDASGRVLPTQTTVEKLQEQVEQDLTMRRQTDATTRLFDAGEALGDRRQKQLREALADAHHGTLGHIARQLGDVFPELSGLDVGVDRVAMEALGVVGAAHALAGWARDRLSPDDYLKLRGLLQEYHASTQVEKQETALSEHARLTEEAEALRSQYRPVPEDPTEMTPEDVQSHLNNQWLDIQIGAKVLEARGMITEAMGHMEAVAALNYALMHDEMPATVDIPLGKVGAAKAMEIAFAAGLRRTEDTRPLDDPDTDFVHVTDGVNDFLRVKGSRLQDLYAPTDPQLAERFEFMRSVHRGDLDEEGWLAAGVLDKIGEYVEPENRVKDIEFNQPMKLTSGMSYDEIHEAVHDYIMGAWDHYQPLEMQNKLYSADFKTDVLGPVGSASRAELEPLYDKAVAEHFPVGEDPETRGLELAGQLDQWRNDWLKKTGQLDEDFESSTIATDTATDSLVTRILAKNPHLSAAYASLRGRYGGDARATLQAYYHQHIFAGNAPDSEAGREDRRRRFLEASRGRYERIKARQQGTSSTGSLFGDDEPEAASSRPSPEQVQDELSRVRAEKSALWETAGEGIKAVKRIDALHAALAAEPAGSAERQKMERALISEAKKVDKFAPEIARWNELSAREGAPDQDNTLLAWQREDEDDHWLATIQNGSHPALTIEGGQLALAPDFVPTYEDLGEESPWQQFVSCFEGSGEQQTNRAYGALQAHLRDEFNKAFVNEYARDRGRVLNQGRRQIPDADDWIIARSDEDTRKAHREARAQGRAQEYAWLRRRVGGKFAAEGVGAVVAKLQAQKRKQGAQQLRVIDPTEIAAPQRDRLYLGEKVEKALQEIVFPRVAPDFLSARGAPGAGVTMPQKEVRMDGAFIGQQRAIKALEVLKHVGFNHHVGSGKTLAGLGAFTHLHSLGKVDSGLFVVPTSAFGAFTKDKILHIDAKHTMIADPSLSASRRRATYSDRAYQMVAVTQEALREDVSWAVAKHRFSDGAEPTEAAIDRAKQWMLSAPMDELHRAIHDAIEKEGWSRFNFMMMDEAHDTLSRQGKPDSLLGRIADAYTREMPYFVSATAHPVKNDVTEAYDFLQKMDSKYFPHRDTPEGAAMAADFTRRYRNNPEGLQRIMACYSMAEPVSRAHTVHLRAHDLDAHPEQAVAYHNAEGMREKIQAQLKSGDYAGIVSSLEELDPEYFARQGVGEDQDREEWVRDNMNTGKINGAVGARLDHIINAWDMTQNPKMEALLSRVIDPGTTTDIGPDGGQRILAPPTVVFAEHRAAVDGIHDHLKSLGYRVGKIDGSVGGKDRDRLRKQFEGDGYDEPQIDILVMSDAGSQSMNLPRAMHIYQWDTPWNPMGFEQRNGRGDRANRVGDLQVHHARLRVPREAHRSDTLQGKQEVSDAARHAYESLDDTGVLRDIMEKRDQRLAMLEGLEQNARDAHREAAGG